MILEKWVGVGVMVAFGIAFGGAMNIAVLLTGAAHLGQLRGDRLARLRGHAGGIGAIKMRSIDEITTEWIKENKVAYFGHRSDERLSAESIDECVDGFIDDCEIDCLPATLEVTAFRRVCISIDGQRLLDHILKGLDEKYGDPDGEADEPTTEMRIRADALAKTITEEYMSWCCEPVETFTVDVIAWRAEMVERGD